jgi:hypothetical protein
MARRVFAAPKNDVYTGMLAVTCFAILVGIITLAIEQSSDYDFEMEAKGGPSITLPTKDISPVNANPNPNPMGGGNGGAMALPAEPKPEIAKTEPAPAPVEPKLPELNPVVATPAPVPVVATPAPAPAATKPEDKPKGPVPSPFKLPGMN